MKRPISGNARSTVLLLAFLFLTACMGGLPPNTKREIAAEAGKLANSRQQVQTAQAAVTADLAKDPDLFRNAEQPAHWKASLQNANQQLTEAEKDDQTLENLVRHNRADTRLQADRLLEEEQRLRSAAVAESQTVRSEADKWIAFKATLPGKLNDLEAEHRTLHDYQLASLEQTVHKAETDWPAKKSQLETRLQTVEEIPASPKRNGAHLKPPGSTPRREQRQALKSQPSSPPMNS